MPLLLLVAVPAAAQLPVYGDYSAHDPSRILKQGANYYVFRTSQGIMGKTSTDLRNWTYSGQIFPGNPPAWTTNAVPGFTGDFWAPDGVFLNGVFYLYYAVSTFGSQVSAIGLVTTTNLATGPWLDQGAVIQSANGSAYNCIDPCPLLDTNGTFWLTFGSYWNGIYLVQLDPATGKRLSANSPITRLAYNSSIEGSFLCQHGGSYYLFVNWDACCQGINSTYNIRVGRSSTVTGPYLDRAGVNLVNDGGSMFLESTARFIGPGQVGIMNDNGTNWLTYHYYDGNNAGNATLGLGRLDWSADGWPAFTNDWSAFYTFNTDAREHLGLYNGALKSTAAIVNDPARGNVLNLDGAGGFVILSNSVANCSTIAAWVKWNGGANGQHLFDLGAGTGAYFYLSPRSAGGNLRFGLTLSGSGGEQQINAPFALPTNAWVHLAVTLDGTTGLLYLDGVPVATNNALTIRPWQTLARTNYLGKSQSPSDPLFSGRIDSLRVFGRALSGTEIRDLAYAHPALAHRYSFNTNAPLPAWDSLGMAHGSLMGNARQTNGALVLDGTAGTYVNLPGGLVSGSSAVTLECWATLGTNGNWPRLADFGNFSGATGLDYFFYSPHTSLAGQRLELSTNKTVTVDLPGTLDGRTVHVVCLVDPANHYGAVYTNAVLESAATNTWPALNSVSTAWSFIGRSLFSSDAYLNAVIDELRLYDGRLTPQEIAADYQNGPDALALPVTLAATNSAVGWTLSWPSWAAGFTLQVTTNLAAGHWATNAPSPALANDLWSVQLSPTNAAAWYRLAR